MCGIVGRVDFDGTDLSELDLSASLTSLRVRGPDAHGTWRRPWAALGHTRLAIVDLDERSNQPFISADRNYVLTYNGEIYNHPELRRELQQDWRFTTTGDTEVVLAALVTWGTEAFSRFNGMWALALVDVARRRLLLARDRFGVKPLYVAAETPGGLVFGSTVTALQTLLDTPLSPDMNHLSRYLVTAASHLDSSTFYEGVRELSPGTWLEVSAGSRREGRYWDLPLPQPGRRIDTDRLEWLLRDSVHVRLRSDVPVGITLSGGLDSSLIATMMSDEAGASMAFTASDGGSDSESEEAEAYADLLGMPWLGVDLPTRLGPEFLAARIAELDGPNASPAANAVWCIMRNAAAAGRRVVLEGQGADEIFGGYSTIVGPFWLKDRLLHRDLTGARRAWLGLTWDLGTRQALQHSIRRLVPGAHETYGRRRGNAACLTGELDVRVEPLTRPGMTAAEVLHSCVNDVLRSLLHYGDRMSMAHSVETRQPFLDYRIVEEVSSSDIAQRFAEGRGKDSLRAVGVRVLRSQQPARAPKRGFPVPTLRWIQDPECKDLLARGRLVERGLLDAGKVRDLLDSAATGRAPMRTQSAYRLLTAELWWRDQGW